MGQVLFHTYGRVQGPSNIMFDKGITVQIQDFQRSRTENKTLYLLALFYLRHHPCSIPW
jgi:hypothetical protein